MERKPMIDEKRTTISLENEIWKEVIETLYDSDKPYLAKWLWQKFKTAHSTVHKQGC